MELGERNDMTKTPPRPRPTSRATYPQAQWISRREHDERCVSPARFRDARPSTACCQPKRRWAAFRRAFCPVE